MPNTIVFDTEILGGRFLFKGRVLENRNLISIWSNEDGCISKLRDVMNSGCLFVSFNGIKFDIPIISAVMCGKDIKTVKMIADSIIKQEMQPWEAERRFGLPPLKVDHIDLIEVAPSFVGLKTYMARMHSTWLRDLPFPHDVESLTEEEFQLIGRYCENDLDGTEELFKHLEDQLLLRLEMSKMYNVDLRSKSDTQMAETSFIQKLNIKRVKKSVPYTINYKMPDYVNFEAEHLQELACKMQNHEYLMNMATGHVILPDFLKDKVSLNKGLYQLGVGGIHSTHDKKVCHVSTDDWVVTDIDAASYYPTIWVKWGSKLENTDQALTEEYSKVYHRRLEAKKQKDKKLAENLKVPINGTFGKLLSRYSPLYNPELGLFITLTGQLTLLNLIEKLEKIGATALSANTDGIAMAYPKHLTSKVEDVVSEFSKLTGYDFEYTPYRVLAMKDVNNYLAVKADRTVKAKGIYADAYAETSIEKLKKNPTSKVCAYAVGQWLAHGTLFGDTIRDAPFTDFISARNVTGGGVQGEEYLGKVVRWYQTTDKTLPGITYGPGKKEGDRVAKTEGARSCMVLKNKQAHPADLDYTWYLKEAISIAINVGCSAYLSPEELALVEKPAKVKRQRKVNQ